MARNENLPVRHQGDTWLSPTRSTDLWRPDAFFSGSPWQMMRRMQEDMERMFGDAFSGVGAISPWQGGTSGQGLQTWNPSVDVSEDQNEYTIEVDLPGVRKDDIHVEVQNGQVTLRAEMRQESGDGQTGPQGQQGQQNQNQQNQNQQNQQWQQGSQGQQGQRQYLMRERRYGYFSRTFPLPDDVNEDQIRCDFRDGVLTCHMPKSEQKKAQARHIPIGESSQPRISSQQGGQASNAGAPEQADKNKRKAA